MAYTVLARRYRSQTFDDVIGQDAVAQTLKNAIKTEKVSHAYLFCGTRGVGKTTVARVLAKCLNCLSVSVPTITPCCECESCTSINTGEDIDVIEIDGASNNGVDNIRELRNNAIFRPARSRYKVYIIDEIHMLSTGAFNALLKILEEPPAHVKFIFATTEPNKVLPTIQSRCQRFDFRAIDAGSIGRQLKSVLDSEKITYEEDLITAVSRLANGSMRDALSLLDHIISAGEGSLTLELLETTLGQPGRSRIAALLGHIADSDAGAALATIDGLLTDGMSCLQIADALVEYMRDVMVASTAGADSPLLVLTAAEKKSTAELAAKFDVPALVYGVTAFERSRGIIKNSENSRAILEASIVRLALSENFIGVQSLLQQLGKAAMVKKKSPNITKLVSAAKLSQTAAPQTDRSPQQQSTDVCENEFQRIVCKNFEDFTNNWQRIKDAIKSVEPMLASILSNAQPLSFEDNCLSIEFPAGNMSISLLNDNGRNKRACAVLSDITGTMLTVKAVTSATAVSTAPKPKGARAGSKKRQEVLNNQGVQAILKAFKAEVVDIST